MMIELVQPSDHEEIKRIHRSSFHTNYLVEESDITYIFRLHHRSPVVGYITLRPFPERRLLWIHCLDVHPSFQRRGIGRQLITYGLEYAGRLKMTQVSLLVDPKNVPAVRLYQSVGFKKTGGWSMTCSLTS